jgi:hypothetical protein
VTARASVRALPTDQTGTDQTDVIAVKNRDKERERGRDHRGRREKEKPAKPVILPFHARELSRRDLETYEPMFAMYLDIQKGHYIEDMKEDEVKGRWKSFIQKWYCVKEPRIRLFSNWPQESRRTCRGLVWASYASESTSECSRATNYGSRTCITGLCTRWSSAERGCLGSAAGGRWWRWWWLWPENASLWLSSGHSTFWACDSQYAGSWTSKR